MQVSQIMTKSVIWIEPENLIKDAAFLMDFYHIAHVPVVASLNVIGVVDRKSCHPEALTDPVTSHMNGAIILCNPNDSVAFVGRRMLSEGRLVSLVVDHGDLVGIVTSTDLRKSRWCSFEPRHAQLFKLHQGASASTFAQLFSQKRDRICE